MWLLSKGRISHGSSPSRGVKEKEKKKEKERKIKIKSHCVGSFGASVIQHAASAQGYDLF